MSGSPGFHVRVLDTEPRILEARRLAAARYLDVGFVDVLPDAGVLDDQWLDEAEYFGVIDDLTGELLATARLIRMTERGIPVFNDLELDADGRRWRASVDDLELAELSAFAARRGVRNQLQMTRHLFRAMFHHVIERDGPVHWVSAVETGVLRMLRRLVGLNQPELGPVVWYRGGETVPTVVDVYRQMYEWQRTGHRATEFFNDGLMVDPDRRTITHLAPDQPCRHLPRFESSLVPVSRVS